MLCYSILYYAMLYYTILYYTTLYYTILYYKPYDQGLCGGGCEVAVDTGTSEQFWMYGQFS